MKKLFLSTVVCLGLFNMGVYAQTLAPDGSFVGGNPELAPDGTFTGE